MRASLSLAALAALATISSAEAAPTAYDHAFVDAFAAACVPGRLTYEASRAAAFDAGWSEVAPDAHPELSAIMELAEAEVADPEPVEASFASTLYSKLIDAMPHYLVVSRTSAIIDDPDDPWVYVGCHLYNLDATAPVDPEPVTALIGNPISATHPGADGTIAHVWGPPCPMPRTGDTYLSFVAPAGVAGVPFTGVALNFSTSELAPGEAIPDPYC